MAQKKIAVMGLDNAGKTSVLTLLRKKFNVLEEIEGLKPTVLVDRSTFNFLGQEFYQHDYGGQESFRENYLANPDRFLSGTDLLVYIVDVQDGDRIQESAEYLEAIMEYFCESDQQVDTVVLFHKMDPGNSNTNQLREASKNFIEAVESFDTACTVHYFETSVYDLPSVVKAFSFSVRLLFSDMEAVEHLLEEVASKFENFMALVLFEGSGISLGEIYKEHITVHVKSKILELYEQGLRRIVESNSNTFEFSERISADLRISGAIQAFKIAGVLFLLMIVFEERSDVAEVALVNELDFFEGFTEQIEAALGTLLMDSHEQQAAYGNV